MKPRDHPYVLILLITLVSSCKKTSTTPPSFTAGYSVYIAGTAGTGAVYWKNGNMVTLSSTGFPGVGGIAVSGLDVYVAGEVARDNGELAVYWKNGTQINLTDTGYANTYGIAISGTDVYVVGLANGPNARAAYWKNRTLHYLDDNNGIAYGIVVKGPDVNVVGHVYSLSNGGFDTSVLWLNGIRDNHFWSIGTTAVFSAITMVGSDTFVTGYGSGGGFYAKNTELTSLLPNAANSYVIADAITVAGTDVYVAGVIVDINGIRVPAYWKNGNLTILQAKAGAASGVGVAGDDVYITGTIFENNNYLPVYWKNGALVRLADSGNANAITVVKN